VTSPRPSPPGRRLSGDLRRAGLATRRAARAGARGVRSVTGAKGAAESGLARVMELHLVSTAADTLIVTALATTIFFAVPTGEARTRVALSLVITMVPFALLAPVLGPLLDRVRRGRRYALATTMVGRAFVAWVMAGAVGGKETGFGLYPAAFGFLVAQKAYLVTRAAAVPRVLPHGTGLVAANARISLAGVAAMALCAPLGAGLNTWVGSQWTLRLAFVVFAAGTALALALPAMVDSAEGEEQARITGPIPVDAAPGSGPADDGAPGGRGRSGGPGAADGGAGRAPSAAGRPARRRGNIGPRVVRALRMNAALRGFTGFLTLFLAFRLRADPLPDLGADAAVAAILVMAGVGGAVGTALGSRMTGARTRGAAGLLRPDRLVVGLPGLVTLASAWAALGYGTPAILTVAAVAGLAQALGKLCLDALIQRDVGERVRTSAFARSETVLQLAWVVGGLVGLVLPLSGAWGLGIAGVATGAAALVTVVFAVRARQALPARG
jgi:hypothetical protein